MALIIILIVLLSGDKDKSRRNGCVALYKMSSKHKKMLASGLTLKPSTHSTLKYTIYF